LEKSRNDTDQGFAKKLTGQWNSRTKFTHAKSPKRGKWSTKQLAQNPNQTTPSFAGKHEPPMRAKQLAQQKEFKLRHMNEISMQRYHNAHSVGAAAHPDQRSQTQVFKSKGLPGMGQGRAAMELSQPADSYSDANST
jgi:hypothetical protein